MVGNGKNHLSNNPADVKVSNDNSVMTSASTAYTKSNFTANQDSVEIDDLDGKTAAVGIAVAASALTSDAKDGGSQTETTQSSTNATDEKTAKQAAIDADKKKLAADAQAAREAEKRANEEFIAAEKTRAENERLANEAADKLAKEAAIEADKKKLVAEAEAARVAAEKAKAKQASKEAVARAQADKFAAEQQATKDAEDKLKTDRTASKKADIEAATKAQATEARAKQVKKDAAAKAEIDNVAPEQKAATGVADSSNSDKPDTGVSVTENMRPDRLSAPRDGQADDLKRISGIGPVIEGTLNEEGVYHFQQIADFTPDNVKWVDQNVAIPGRVERDDWIGQSQALIEGREYDGYAKGIAGTDDPSLPAVTEDMRPTRLAGATGGKPDDLKRINGIGPVIEKTLNDEGIYHFQQIANFTPDNVSWVDKHISFPGRITREEWIRQATGLAAGDITEDMRPTRRALTSGEKADDLKVISGIGPVIEKSLNEQGIYFYQQIADFNEGNTTWVDNHMAFPGRIHREDWIGQDKILAKHKSVEASSASGLGSTGAIPDSMKPTLLSKPEGGKADDLKRIKGIGKVLEKNLHELGVYHYEQLAELTPDNIHWLTDYVSFPENRINDENWTGQAKALAEGKQTDYSKRFDDGGTPYK